MGREEEEMSVGTLIGMNMGFLIFIGLPIFTICWYGKKIIKLNQLQKQLINKIDELNKLPIKQLKQQNEK